MVDKSWPFKFLAVDGIVSPSDGNVVGFVGIGDSAGGAIIIKEDALGVLGAMVVAGMTIKGFGGGGILLDPSIASDLGVDRRFWKSSIIYLTWYSLVFFE